MLQFSLSHLLEQHLSIVTHFGWNPWEASMFSKRPVWLGYIIFKLGVLQKQILLIAVVWVMIQPSLGRHKLPPHHHHLWWAERMPLAFSEPSELLESSATELCAIGRSPTPGGQFSEGQLRWGLLSLVHFWYWYCLIVVTEKFYIKCVWPVER